MLKSGIFRAAADPARLRLIDRLSDGEQCVSTLSEQTGGSMSLVSQQLKLMYVQNVVIQRRVGKHIFYALTDQHIENLLRSVLTHAGQCQPSQ